MSAVHHYKLTCDHGGCTAEINLGLTRADRTRVEAAKQGWRHVVVVRQHGGPSKTEDRCPTHAS